MDGSVNLILTSAVSHPWQLSLAAPVWEDTVSINNGHGHYYGTTYEFWIRLGSVTRTADVLVLAESIKSSSYQLELAIQMLVIC